MGFYDQKVLADKQKSAQAQLDNIDFKLKKIKGRSVQDLYDQHEIRTLTTQRDRLKLFYNNSNDNCGTLKARTSMQQLSTLYEQIHTSMICSLSIIRKI